MPRRGRGGATGGRSPSPPPAGGRSYSSSPRTSPPPPKSRSPGHGGQSKPAWHKTPGLGGAIAGSFLGSVLGSVLGNAISHRMYAGRDPETGEVVDSSKDDKNPCKKELDYFLNCAKYAEDPSYCKGASDSLKRCAERNKAYFEEDGEP